MLLAFILIPLLQKQLDIFKDTIWNTHRIRVQKDMVLPDGIPNHIYYVALCSLPHPFVFPFPTNDFLDEVFRKEYERIIPHPEELEPKDCSKAFI